MEPPRDDRRAGLDGIRELASRESAGIVVAAAERIERLIAEAEAELRVLKGTIEAARPSSEATDHAGAAAPVLPVSAPARDALDNARRALDRFAGELASSSTGSTETARVRIRRTSALLGAAMLLLAAGALGIATGWLAIPPQMAPLEQSSDLPPESDASASAATVATPVESGRRPDARDAPDTDDLRESSTIWLRAYLDGRETAVDARLASAVVRDERAPSERLQVAAARRTIAPPRVNVAGDAAVLSTSVTERSADGRELVSLVSQLWTRKAGRWYLDDVRIVSKAGAEQAFRR